MIFENIIDAEIEAKRFLQKIQDVRNSEANKDMFKKSEERNYSYTSKETAALKRASMDLTRALSLMRTIGY